MRQIPSIKAVMTPFPYAVEADEPLARALEVMEQHDIRHLPILFEDLIVNPEREVARLGSFLGADVAMDHLRSTYDGVLYRRPKSLKDTAEAALIYLKNYRERLR